MALLLSLDSQVEQTRDNISVYSVNQNYSKKKKYLKLISNKVAKDLSLSTSYVETEDYFRVYFSDHSHSGRARSSTRVNIAIEMVKLYLENF